MPRILRIASLTLALVTAAAAWPRAQSGAGQKPPDPGPAAAAAANDARKPAEPAQELPADAKAFNAAAGEKNPLKRVEALEKFIADSPKASPMLLSTAKSQITSSALAAFKDSRAKFLALTEKDIADAAKRTDTMPLYSTYNRLASALMTAGTFSEEAEDYARKGVAAMEERAYIDMRKKQYERSLAAYEKMTASAAGAKAEAPPSDPAPTPPVAAPPTPAEAAPAAPTTPAAVATPTAPAPAALPSPNYRFAMKDGVMQASLAPPAPPRPSTPPRPAVRPKMPTDIEMRAGLKAERATALATLGQILMKRGKTEEGEKVLAGERPRASVPHGDQRSRVAPRWRRAGFRDIVVAHDHRDSCHRQPHPTLRLPLYPSQFLIAMAIVSIGPLLHPMMRDLGVPLSRGGLVSAGLFLGNASAIVVLNTALARFPAKTVLLGGTLLQAAALAWRGSLPAICGRCSSPTCSSGSAERS